MTTDVILWRMRHRASGVEMVCQVVGNELVLTVAGDPIPLSDPRVRQVLKTLQREPQYLPTLMQLAMGEWPAMFVREGWRMEE